MSPCTQKWYQSCCPAVIEDVIVKRHRGRHPWFHKARAIRLPASYVQHAEGILPMWDSGKCTRNLKMLRTDHLRFANIQAGPPVRIHRKFVPVSTLCPIHMASFQCPDSRGVSAAWNGYLNVPGGVSPVSAWKTSQERLPICARGKNCDTEEILRCSMNTGANRIL